MKYICVQPAIDYYAWQVEVMLSNFEEIGIDLREIQIIVGVSVAGDLPCAWQRLRQKYPAVSFFFYRDNRRNPAYAASIRPYLLMQHWQQHSDLAEDDVFYHDCDILFTRRIDFAELLGSDAACLVSDTASYTGASAISKAGPGHLEQMAEMVGISPEFLRANEHNSGGAQYLLRQIPVDFWAKVYFDCERLYRVVGAQLPPDSPLQIGFADMWALLWNLWLFGKNVQVTSELAFSWATSPIQEWYRRPIFHNAGASGHRADQFFKGDYINRWPFDVQLTSFSQEFCSYKYVESIVRVGATSCLRD